MVEPSHSRWISSLSRWNGGLAPSAGITFGILLSGSSASVKLVNGHLYLPRLKWLWNRKLIMPGKIDFSLPEGK